MGGSESGSSRSVLSAWPVNDRRVDRAARLSLPRARASVWLPFSCMSVHTGCAYGWKFPPPEPTHRVCTVSSQGLGGEGGGGGTSSETRAPLGGVNSGSRLALGPLVVTLGCLPAPMVPGPQNNLVGEGRHSRCWQWVGLWAPAVATLSAPSVLGMGVDVAYLEQFGTSQVSSHLPPRGLAQGDSPSAAVTLGCLGLSCSCFP